MKGPDHKFAMEPKDFKNMINKIRKIESGLGSGNKGILSTAEKEMALKGRRSIHSLKELKKNEIIKKNDLIFKRPGFGIQPYKWKKLIGFKVQIKKIKKDFWIKWGRYKKILITGSEGYLGKSFYNYLTKKKFCVKGISKSGSDIKLNLLDQKKND